MNSDQPPEPAPDDSSRRQRISASNRAAAVAIDKRSLHIGKTFTYPASHG
jgi:hypothetical protein